MSAMITTSVTMELVEAEAGAVLPNPSSKTGMEARESASNRRKARETSGGSVNKGGAFLRPGRQTGADDGLTFNRAVWLQETESEEAAAVGRYSWALGQSVSRGQN